MNTAYELFNLIAPLHIYHRTDVRYKKQAQEGYKALVKKQEKFSAYEQVKEIVSLSFNEVNNQDVWTLYDALFEEIIEMEWSVLKKTRDRYGAKAFEYEGKMYFVGDDSGTYAYSVNYMAILESIEYYKKNRRLIG